MNLAVIPARSGSKRVPGKNTKLFSGSPMISHAIKTAIESNLFKHVVVSTDCEQIASIARLSGAVTPFRRPAHLADDDTPTAPVVVHAIEACRSLGWEVKKVCCIYPCTPLLTVDDLIGSFRELPEDEPVYGMSVAKFPSSIWRGFRVASGGKLEALYPQYTRTQTQELEEVFYDAGQFYWGGVDTWLEKDDIHVNAVGYEIPEWRAIDIDTPDDWTRAELAYRHASA